MRNFVAGFAKGGGRGFLAARRRQNPQARTPALPGAGLRSSVLASMFGGMMVIAGLGFDLKAQAQSASSFTNAFFPFCIDWHDSKKRDFVQQSEMLKELGYTGVGHIWLDRVQERLQALDAMQLKLYQITIMVDMKPEKATYDPQLKRTLSQLKGRGTQILLLMNGMKPSDPAGDEKGIAVVREIAELGRESGVVVLLYPHTDFWLERFEDAMRLEKKVSRPSVGTMFNLCHWLRVSKDRDYRKSLQAGANRLMAVSINGADVWDDKPGWEHYIQPLGKGDFDVLAFLKTLKEIGFKGPVGLQCYGIGGDTRDHLAESMKTWREYCGLLNR